MGLLAALIDRLKTNPIRGLFDERRQQTTTYQPKDHFYLCLPTFLLWTLTTSLHWIASFCLHHCSSVCRFTQPVSTHSSVVDTHAIRPLHTAYSQTSTRFTVLLHDAFHRHSSSTTSNTLLIVISKLTIATNLRQPPCSRPILFSPTI